MEDDNIKFILEKIIANQKPSYEEMSQANMNVKSLNYYWDSLEVKNNVLYRKWFDNKGVTIYQLVVPDILRKEIFDQLHSSRTAGHFGHDRTVESTECRFYWSGLKKDVTRLGQRM